MCCCGTDDNPFYLELFPVVTIQSGEKSLSGTYSFWLNLEDTTLSESTLMFDYVTGATNTNATADITYNSTTGIAMVFPPNGNGDIGTKCLKDGVTSFSDHTLLLRADTLVRRGMEPKTTSRVVRLSDVLALSENRILFSKIESKTNAGVPGTYWYDRRGFVFVNDQYHATPAVSTTVTRNDGETFNWEIYPKVSANLPEKIVARNPNDNTHEEWFDFTHTFPNTITIRHKATHDIQVQPRQFVNDFVSIDLDATSTYTKTVTGYSDADPGPLGPSTGEMFYTRTSTSSDTWNGSGTSYNYTDQQGNNVTANLKVEYPTTGSVFAHSNFVQGFSPPDEDEDYRGAVRLNKNISTNLNANLSSCTNCDPFGNPRLQQSCTPLNYDSETVNKNVNNSMVQNPISVSDQIFSPNTTGGLVSWPGAAFGPYDIAAIQMAGLAPTIQWGECSASVSFTLQDMKYGGEPTVFYPDGPQIGCLYGNAGSGDFVFAFRGLPPGGGDVEVSIGSGMFDFIDMTTFSLT